MGLDLKCKNPGNVCSLWASYRVSIDFGFVVGSFVPLLLQSAAASLLDHRSMMKPKAMYVYLQTTMHLWRFDLEAIDYSDTSKFDEVCNRGHYPGPGESDHGVLTKLLDFRNVAVPLGAGGFVHDSKLFFVGGETVTRFNKWVPDQDPLFPFEDVSEINKIYEERGPDPHASGYFQLPISSLNRRIFIFNNLISDEPVAPTIEISGSESQSKAPKTYPLVVPLRRRDKTLVYVIARSPRYYAFDTWGPSFEVFDPSLNSWEALPEPPYLDPMATLYPSRLAFEFQGKIVLLSITSKDYDELTFDPKTKRWHRTCLFQMKGLSGRRMIHVDGLGDDTLFGCFFDEFLAFRVGTNGGIDSLIVGDFSPYWPTTNFDHHTTVCDLGNGFVLFTSVTVDEDLEHLHFYFVTLRVSRLIPRKCPLGSWDDSIPFVSAETKQFCHRVVPCDNHSLMRPTYVYNAYVL